MAGSAKLLFLRWSGEVFGWEAGTRTPIARSRVWSPTIGRPPSKEELEFTYHAQTCQQCLRLGPRLKVKLMLELQCIKMHNGSVCSDFERLTFRKQRQLLYFQVPGETTERR